MTDNPPAVPAQIDDLHLGYSLVTLDEARGRYGVVDPHGNRIADLRQNGILNTLNVDPVGGGGYWVPGPVADAARRVALEHALAQYDVDAATVQPAASLIEALIDACTTAVRCGIDVDGLIAPASMPPSDGYDRQIASARVAVRRALRRVAIFAEAAALDRAAADAG